MKSEEALFNPDFAKDNAKKERKICFASKSRVKQRRLYFAVKRVMDIVLSLLALILLSPLFLIVAILIKADSPGPAFYIHNRVGKNGKTFRMYKFRSMCVDADRYLGKLAAQNEREGPAFKISDDPRITRAGRGIRRTCIDELPQLLNILKGDMSIVGPRPPLPAEVEQYTPYQYQRLAAKPGLTCYWQTHKGKVSTFNEWVGLDIKYIQNQNFRVDAKLILQTITFVLKNKGDE